MIEIKQNSSVSVPVKLANTSGIAQVGVTYSQVSIGIMRSDGTQSTVTIAGSDWTEATVGSMADRGLYLLKLPSTVTTVPGVLMYTVQYSLSVVYNGALKVVAYEEQDTFSIIGGPLEIHTSGPLANHMTIYAEDGVTPVRRYALFDKSGKPSTTEIYKRVPVVVD